MNAAANMKMTRLQAQTCDVGGKQWHLGCPADELADKLLSLQSCLQHWSALGSAPIVAAMQVRMSFHGICIFKHMSTLAPAQVFARIVQILEQTQSRCTPCA